MNRISREELEQLSKAEIIELFLKLQEQMIGLANKIVWLENQLGKNSHNSSKPPSTDGFNRPPKIIPNNREKTERKAGGQEGHKGHTLEFATKPDEIIIHQTSHCLVCGKQFTEEGVLYERRQTVEIPPISLRYIEHQAYDHHCCCGERTRTPFPEEIPPGIHYGATVQGLALYEQVHQLQPAERTSEFFEDLFGGGPKAGTLNGLMERIAPHLSDYEAEVKKQLLASPVMGNDETSIRVNKTNHWLHTHSTDSLTYYHLSSKRGVVGMQEGGILEAYRGISEHDHYQSYFCFPQLQHALCNEHHLRELLGVYESTKQLWADQMRNLLRACCHQVKEAKKEGLTSLSPTELAAIEKRYQELIEAGKQVNPKEVRDPKSDKRGKVKQTPAYNLLHRLSDHQTETLRFLYDFRVPFGNSQSERDIRMCKLKQKISGCFRSAKAAKAFFRIRGYLSTMRKLGHNAFDALQALVRGTPIMPSFTPLPVCCSP